MISFRALLSYHISWFRIVQRRLPQRWFLLPITNRLALTGSRTRNIENSMRHGDWRYESSAPHTDKMIFSSTFMLPQNLPRIRNVGRRSLIVEAGYDFDRLEPFQPSFFNYAKSSRNCSLRLSSWLVRDALVYFVLEVPSVNFCEKFGTCFGLNSSVHCIGKEGCATVDNYNTNYCCD